MAEAKKTFSHSLWDAFDQTYERLTAGRRDIKLLKSFLDERAKIEETYAKSMQQLAVKPEFEAKGATLAKCWVDSREATRSISAQHAQLAGVLAKDIGKLLDDEMKMLKNEKTRMHTTHHKLLANREKLQKNHDKLKAKYYESVKVAETAIINRDAGRKEKLPEKNMKKLEQDVEKRLHEVDSGHAAYQDSVVQLKQAQVEYDAALKENLDRFEQLERNRGKFLHDQFQAFAQLHEQMKSSLEQVYLLLAKGVSEVNVESDVMTFIDENESKGRPPAHVEYDPCKSEIIQHARNPSAPMPPSSIPPPPMGPPKGNSVPPPSSQPPPPQSQPVQVQRKESSAPDRKNEQRPSVVKNTKTSSATLTNLKWATALYDFDGSQAGDLSFKQGQKIKILEYGDADWWQGELDGNTGAIPKNYVELVEDGVVAAEQPLLMNAVCKALYDFEAQGADELPFKAGDVLYVTGELNGWYLGKTQDGSRVGIFPSNYVELDPAT